MNKKQFYSGVLGIKSPWRVVDVEVNFEERKVIVDLAIRSNAVLSCPQCGASCSKYDGKRKTWRHLDTCDLQTYVRAQVPRISCAEHGVKMISVPFAEPRSRYTGLFESVVIDWLKDAPISAVAEHMKLSWNAIAGIQQRAVKRGLERRDATALYKQLGIDETSCRKRHDYVTVINNPATGAVIHVCEDRKKESVNGFYSALTEQQRQHIETVTMDMWPAYIGATEQSLENAEDKIAFDKFHVAKYLGDAVDKVRRAENRELRSEGNSILTGTKHGWLRNPQKETWSQRQSYNELRKSNLKTARAWAIKEHAMCLWHYSSRTWTEKAWQQWYGWASRSRLKPVTDMAWTIKRHMWGIVNAVVKKADNAKAESLNSRIKTVKVRSRGFRSKGRYIDSIYFHLGELNMYPKSTDFTHSN